MFKKHKMEVKLVKDNSDGQSVSKPIVVDDVTLDNLVGCYFAYKGFKTLCHIIEAVVESKLK